MESTLEIFLQSLGNYELAAFYHYRLNEFLPASQKKIRDEILNRKMVISDIPFLMERERAQFEQHQKKQFEEIRLCHRCFSERSHIEERRSAGTRYRGEHIVKRNICELCGYDPLITDKGNAESENSLLGWMKKLFRRN